MASATTQDWTEMHIVTAEWGSKVCFTNQAAWPNLSIPGRSIIDKQRMVL
jgi:hypothetical protein